MHKLSCDSYIFEFNKENKPVLRIKSGEVVEIQTLDCFANQIQTEADKLDAIDWDRVNPATGPIYIEEAKPGDVLKVSIESIALADQGAMATGEDLGVLGSKMKGMHEKIIPIKGDEAIFNDKLRLPLNKMIGVIGVAPAGDGVNCGTPGSHGGNMDNKKITEGATLYFPVAVEGALFAIGDIHSVMGDGEIGVSGVETPALVTVKLEVISGESISNPVLEMKDEIAAIASHEDIEKAIEQAVSDMHDILLGRLPMDTPEIAMLLSAVGNVEICQVVDPLKTVRFTFPKWILKKYK